MNLVIRAAQGQGLDQLDLDMEGQEARAAGLDLVVGVVLLRAGGQAFVQRRSLDRKLFPGCWDIVGGHVEPGEPVMAALRREVKEETAWELPPNPLLIARVDWEKAGPGGPIPVLEWDFLARLPGDCPEPLLERAKVDRYAWVGMENIALLMEHRDKQDSFIHDLVAHALEVHRARF
jgi:8-oxo-dGTP diphosphatase